PGRPVTYGTTGEFLEHFGLDQISDLPGLDELKAAGLLSSRLPSGFSIPLPQMELELLDDEDPLEDSGSDDSLEPLDGGDEILPEDES
ncbi:MAG TPA: SMC-Scp complex subunit ScpB, partial [Hyphomicrobiales bacterium]|nr:SMC-Scp complex subunit ScpB [Hyphomicrobiales bacterium]